MPTVRGFEFPDDLHYLMEHDTWARLDADGTAIVGLTSLGAHVSGDFIAFMAKPAGTIIERDRAFGMLEMSKVIRSARAPVGGELIAANAQVRDHPALINRDPYGDGWLVRMRPVAWCDDAARLVSGGAIAPSVLAYMALLSEQFGEDPP